MPLLKVEAEKLSNNMLISGIIEEIIARDDMFSLLPFETIKGKAYVYNREKELGTATWLAPNEEVEESAASFEEVVTQLRILIGDVDVDKFLQSTMSDTNDQLAIQVRLKAKAVAREFCKALASGDSEKDKVFDGISKLVTEPQTIDAGGKSLTFAMLDELLDLIPNGADAIVMNRDAIRSYRQLLRATSGTDAGMQMLPAFGHPVLTHQGIPILMNEFIENGETGTSIYAVRLNELDGLHGLCGGSNAGIVVEQIGTVQDKDATRTRLKWYCGLALKSTKSLACLKNVLVEVSETGGGDDQEEPPQPDIKESTVYSANLKDKDGTVTDIVQGYSVTSAKQGENEYKVTIKGTDLKEHTNGEGTKGHWIGFALVPQESGVDGYKWGTDSASSEKFPLENVHEGEKGFAIYIDHKTDERNSVKFKIQWYKGDNPVGKEITYDVDLTGVKNATA